MRYNVFRMEDFAGYGPWSSGHLEQVHETRQMSWTEKYNDRSIHPTPIDEKLIGNLQGSPWYCGVLNLSSFFYWFPVDQMSDYEKIGSFISVWSIDAQNIKIGAKQVIFRRDRSKLLFKVIPSLWKTLESYNQ